MQFPVLSHYYYHQLHFVFSCTRSTSAVYSAFEDGLMQISSVFLLLLLLAGSFFIFSSLSSGPTSNFIFSIISVKSMLVSSLDAFIFPVLTILLFPLLTPPPPLSLMSDNLDFIFCADATMRWSLLPAARLSVSAGLLLLPVFTLSAPRCAALA